MSMPFEKQKHDEIVAAVKRAAHMSAQAAMALNKATKLTKEYDMWHIYRGEFVELEMEFDKHNKYLNSITKSMELEAPKAV